MKQLGQVVLTRHVPQTRRLARAERADRGTGASQVGQADRGTGVYWTARADRVSRAERCFGADRGTGPHRIAGAGRDRTHHDGDRELPRGPR